MARPVDHVRQVRRVQAFDADVAGRSRPRRPDSRPRRPRAASRPTPRPCSGKWDRSANADSRGAVLFEAWYRHAVRAGNIFAVRWNEAEPLATPRGLGNPAAAVQALVGRRGSGDQDARRDRRAVGRCVPAARRRARPAGERRTGRARHLPRAWLRRGPGRQDARDQRRQLRGDHRVRADRARAIARQLRQRLAARFAAHRRPTRVVREETAEARVAHARGDRAEPRTPRDGAPVTRVSQASLIPFNQEAPSTAATSRVCGCSRSSPRPSSAFTALRTGMRATTCGSRSTAARAACSSAARSSCWSRA